MFREFVTPSLQNQEDYTEWVIEDNEAYWTGAGSAAAVNAFSVIRYSGVRKKYAVRYRRNNVAANNLITQTDTANPGDKSDIMALDIESNINRFGSAPIFSSSSNSWISDMLARGNSTGDTQGGNRIQQAMLDLARLRAGCAFRIGVGTIANGSSASMNGNYIEKLDAMAMRTWNGTAMRQSVDNGATWRVVPLTWVGWQSTINGAAEAYAVRQQHCSRLPLAGCDRVSPKCQPTATVGSPPPLKRRAQYILHHP